MKKSIGLHNDLEAGDKAGHEYWEKIWVAARLSRPVNPRIMGLNNYVDRHLHDFFKAAVGDLDHQGKNFLEIGCGNSAWLPYFAKEFGFNVSGLDYSDSGCENAKEILKRANIAGNVVKANLFRPPSDMEGIYDIVFSFGLVEHFTDTAGCLRACAAFVRPGGLMITMIPNLTGIPGFLQRYFGRDIYDVHVVLSANQLAKAHVAASLDVIRCQHCLFVNLNVLRMQRWRSKWIRTLFVRLGSWISKALWVLGAIVPILRPNPLTSPYILCIARKKLDWGHSDQHWDG
ncbi:MAG: class I SAM-dependent methyltransferase [Acidiferrobacter sp.]